MNYCKYEKMRANNTKKKQNFILHPEFFLHNWVQIKPNLGLNPDQSLPFEDLCSTQKLLFFFP